MRIPHNHEFILLFSFGIGKRNLTVGWPGIGAISRASSPSPTMPSQCRCVGLTCVCRDTLYRRDQDREILCVFARAKVCAKELVAQSRKPLCTGFRDCAVHVSGKGSCRQIFEVDCCAHPAGGAVLRCEKWRVWQHHSATKPFVYTLRLYVIDQLCKYKRKKRGHTCLQFLAQNELMSADRVDSH